MGLLRHIKLDKQSVDVNGGGSVTIIDVPTVVNDILDG